MFISKKRLKELRLVKRREIFVLLTLSLWVWVCTLIGIIGGMMIAIDMVKGQLLHFFIVIDMNSEEYYYIGEYGDMDDIDDLLLSRVQHLKWVLGCFRQGSIRSTTIEGLIPLDSLQRLLIHMESIEEFLLCRIILDLMIERYPTEVN